MVSFRKQQATEIIREHFLKLRHVEENEDVLVSAREAGRRLVEIYRLLTNEMPQSPGIEVEYYGDETPAVEFASPTERDPNEAFYVVTGSGNEPDILIKGDQNGSDEKSSEGSIDEGEQGRRNLRLPEGHRS
jgi:hypothetical protein